MVIKPTYEELEQRVRELESSEDELNRAEGLVQFKRVGYSRRDN